MKKFISILMILVLSFTMLTGCAVSRDIPVQNQTTKEIKTVHAQPYGLFNQSSQIEGVRYEISVGNIVWSVILCETVVVPVVLIGLYLYEPISAK